MNSLHAFMFSALRRGSVKAETPPVHRSHRKLIHQEVISPCMSHGLQQFIHGNAVYYIGKSLSFLTHARVVSSLLLQCSTAKHPTNWQPSHTYSGCSLPSLWPICMAFFSSSMSHLPSITISCLLTGWPFNLSLLFADTLTSFFAPHLTLSVHPFTVTD